jgi:L-cystine uptake protein TcyP (sodium:dicarboxylate symporter family)
MSKQSSKEQRVCSAVGRRRVSGKTFAVGVLASAVGISVACLTCVTALCSTAATATVVAGAAAAGVVTSMALKKNHSTQAVQESTNFYDLLPEIESEATEG